MEKRTYRMDEPTYQELVGKTITSVSHEYMGVDLVLRCSDGSTFAFAAGHDCEDPGSLWLEVSPPDNVDVGRRPLV